MESKSSTFDIFGLLFPKILHGFVGSINWFVEIINLICEIFLI